MTDEASAKPQLSVIVLNYQTDDMTYRLVESLRKGENTEIILVDNSSSTYLAERVHSLSNIKYSNPGKNLGFAGGVNYGIRMSRGEWIMLLNSDAETDPETINRLARIATSQNAKAAAPRLVGKDEKVEKNVGYFPRFAHKPIDWLFLRPFFVQPEENAWVDIASGGALLIHRSVIGKVGLLDDERYFMYFEDIDYSLRLNRAGIRILYVPACIIRHASGGSADKNPSQKKKNFKTSLDNFLLKNRGPIIFALNKVFHFLR